jgi:cyclopropane fatty-acyl-phospholipid synthase-like methyltransferase
MKAGIGTCDLESDILTKNRGNYDWAANESWRLAVYDPVHEGWHFTNIGGRYVLDYIGRLTNLDGGMELLELGCGMADTCRYLVEHYSCRVTGVEMNQRQIETARARLAKAPPGVGERLRLIHADLRVWQPDRLYDLVYAIDSLMLIPDLGKMLDKGRSALRPGGTLVIADVIAGPGCTDRLRQQVWDLDGIITLETSEQYRTLLVQFGFADIRIKDLTELGIRCFTTIACAARRLAAHTNEPSARTSWEKWLEVALFYERCFRERQLLYSRISASADRPTG